MEILILIIAILLLGAEGLFFLWLLRPFLEKERPGQDLPPLPPFAAHKAKKEDEAALREKDRLDTILRNIENYDGTGANQEDVPGR